MTTRLAIAQDHGRIGREGDMHPLFHGERIFGVARRVWRG